MRLGQNAIAKLAAVGILLGPLSAAAQNAGAEGALAEALYQKGRQLMAEGKFSEACPKFAESYRLDAATGTLLNLASCHEGERKLASAWLELTEALASARRDHRDDRVKFAEEHLAALETKLSRLTVALAPSADIADLKVQVDGIVVLAAARGIPAPVDPGEHVVEAQAPGRKPFSQRFTITEQAKNITVTIPLLETEAPPAPLASAPPASPSPPAAAETTSRPIPSSVYVTGGATLVLAVGAGVTGYGYMKDHNDTSLNTESHRWGVANIVLTAGALIGGGVTAYLYFTRPAQSSSSASLSVTPWVAPSGGGVSVGGSL